MILKARVGPACFPWIFRQSAATLALFLLFVLPSAVRAREAPSFQPRSEHPDSQIQKCRILYLGVVGGLETPNNHRSGVVQIRDVLRGPEYEGVCSKTVSPYVWRKGLTWILEHFPSDTLKLGKPDLAAGPKIVLVGHSLGGWAVLSIARNLNRRNIPVELCIQIDSVGITDHTVPANVHAAAIFHARDILWPLVTKHVKINDASATKLVDDVLVRNAGHESVTRDPRIRELVLRTVALLRGSSRR